MGVALRERIIEGPALKRRFHTLKEMFEATLAKVPDQVFMRERTPDGWREISYRQMHDLARRVGALLRDHGLSEERPLAILSGNSIDHAIFSFAGILRGIPVSPISAAYAKFSDQTRLRAIFDILTPGLVFAESGVACANGLGVADEIGALVLVSREARPASHDRIWSELTGAIRDDTRETLPVTPQTIAKVLFTSGSTGSPKGVIVTNEMSCADQDGIAQFWPFLEEVPPVAVDWLPWSHIFGGNMIVNLVLRNAGTLTIDEGRPNAQQFGLTIRNLREVRPTMHFGVPIAYRELANALERDETLAAAFFSRLRRMFTAGSALPVDVWDRLHALAARHGRPDFCFHIGWGATETAPVVSMSPIHNRRADSIGVPIAGARIKMVPSADKLELRVSGPMVTPGYWRSPDLTKKAFDAEGYYCIGDAGRLLDESDPAQGIIFDGRTAENFKLSSGTWVAVTALTLSVLQSGAPVIQDVAITGQDRDEIGLLVFPNLEACRSLTGLHDADMDALVLHADVRAFIVETMRKVNRGGSSTRIMRAMLLTDRPSVERGEMTDKGYLNQRAVLRAREDAIARLYSDPDGDVLYAHASS